MSYESPAKVARSVLQSVLRAASERAAAEVFTRSDLESALRGAIDRRQSTLERLEQSYQDECIAALRDHDSACQLHSARGAAESGAIERECDLHLERTAREISLAEQEATHAHKESRWMAACIYESSTKRLKEQAVNFQKSILDRLAATRGLRDSAVMWVKQLGWAALPPLESQSRELPAYEASDAPPQAIEQMDELVLRAGDHLSQLRRLWLPKVARDEGLLALSVLIAVATFTSTWLVLGPRPLAWITAGVMCTTLFATPACLAIRRRARRAVCEELDRIMTGTASAELLGKQVLRQTAVAARNCKRRLRADKNAEVRRSASALAAANQSCARRRATELPGITQRADEALAASQQRLRELVNREDERLVHRRENAHMRRECARLTCENTHQQVLDAARTKCEQYTEAGTAAWKMAFKLAGEQLTAICGANSPAFATWDDLSRIGWQPCKAPPGAIRIGELSRPLEELVDTGAPDFRRELADAGAFTMPALVDLSEGRHLLIKTTGMAESTALALANTATLRILASFPPGKVRFTFIDPVGLGENFAPFMHLADHSELLINHRIWTEAADIERRLSESTAHIETVNQKYLRDEFSSLQEYNDQAGELVEPWRVLVVANFPVGFTEAAAKRLAAIIAHGPRCGLYVVLTVDTSLPMPSVFSLTDATGCATVFTSQRGVMTWQDPDCASFSLSVDRIGIRESLALLRDIGETAAKAQRVDVPFAAIAPESQHVWASDSRQGIELPLGLSGARRFQRLTLGEGTSQHVLIAGKTGAGKSSLLHTLITNAALRYGPGELGMYLIDFKKGVEFKDYVTFQLPHARVVAIESEREFGLSVMQRLDAEMRRRGELFRCEGVQDIARFRDVGHSLARLLFVVDEFQEFFVQDDRLAQEASLLLDRLVRQGRAFGIHVILGSQTLGGAYSLPRSTLGQMAVRIALQCSEADARVILSDDNSAAQLLTRPGEAIYNDANGRREGNRLFQVAWLPDDRREFHLKVIEELGGESRRAPDTSTIVFEGSQPAELSVSSILDSGHGIQSPASQRILLGEPLAIDQPTSISLPLRNGTNVLWIGQNREAIDGMLSCALASLVGRSSGDARPHWCLLHGGRLDGPLGTAWRFLATTFPEQVRIFGATETDATVKLMLAEVRRRQMQGDDAPGWVWFVHDLARCRGLRRKVDEFAFSRAEESEPRPDRDFLEVLREGPLVGVHTLVWCDTLGGFNRSLDRSALREFGTRVLVQMSAADSSLLIDSPAASELGKFRAFAHVEDEGRLEKFRPYRPPTEDWWHALRQAACQWSTSDVAPTVTGETRSVR